MALNDRFNKLFGLDDERQPDTDFNQRTDVDDKVTAMDNIIFRIQKPNCII